MDQQLDFGQYLRVFKRRRTLFIVPFFLSLILSVLIVFLLPSKYKATATILIEAQEIPQDLVRTTVTGYVEERLQTITQLVLSRRNLLEIIKNHGLYADLADTHTTEEIIDRMRRDISLDPVVADVVNPQLGRPMPATIAFALSYEGKDPRVVAQVANTLVSLYMQENIKNREGKANTAFFFLERQLAELTATIAETEAAIARFKDENLYSLPELVQLNLQNMERLRADIRSTQEQVRMLEDRRIALKGQLAVLEPLKFSVMSDGSRVLTPEEELKALRSRYLALKSARSDNHPDVIMLANQIAGLESEVGARDRLSDRTRELENKRTEFELLARRHSEIHPDVIKARKEVDRLDQEVQSLSTQKRVLTQGAFDQPDNPSYIMLQTQIEQVDLEIRKTQSLLADLRDKYDQYQRRLELTPKVEQEYSALQRDYLNAQTKHRDTMARLQSAKEAKGLEESKMAEKLTVIDPPAVPEKPFKPKRLVLLVMALFLSLGVGFAFGMVAEVADSSIHDHRDLERLSPRPILAVVPYLETTVDRMRCLRRRLAVSLGTSLVAVAGLTSVHFFYRPLNVVWYQILKKASVMF